MIGRTRSVSGVSRSAWHLPVHVADLKPCARSGASTPRVRTCASRCRRRPRPPRTRTEYHPVGLSASVRGAAFASGRGGHPRRGVETTQKPAPEFSTTSPCEGKGGGVPVGLHRGSHERVVAREHERPAIPAFQRREVAGGQNAMPAPRLKLSWEIRRISARIEMGDPAGHHSTPPKMPMGLSSSALVLSP